MEEIVNEVCPRDELLKFQKQYEEQLTRGQPSTKTQFEYAYCLVRSAKSTDVDLGIALLEDLLTRDEDGMAKRDYLFYLSVGNLRRKDCDRALKFVDALLRVEDTNSQALELRKVIEKRQKKDALIGSAILGGAALAGGAILAAGIAILANKSK